MVFATAGVTGPLVAQPNSWNYPFSGNWEDPHWSLGVLPGPGQEVLLTNAGWKAVAINPATRQYHPESLVVSNLVVAAPEDSRNTLLLNYFNSEVPLHVTGGVTIGTNGTLRSLYSGLVVEGELVVTNGSYQQESGTLVVQGSMMLHGGECSLSGSQLQLGELIVGRHWPSAVHQVGGISFITNLTVSSLVSNYWVWPGYPATNYGAADATYSLTNGTLQCASLKVGAGTLGTFYQVNSDVRADAIDLGFPLARGVYYLASGSLQASSLHVGGGGGSGSFIQQAGTNWANDITIASSGSYFLPKGGGAFLLGGGRLESDRVTVGGALSASFCQTGGTHVIRGPLSISGATGGSIHQLFRSSYSLQGGSLETQTFSLGGLATFSQGDAECHIRGPATIDGFVSPYTWRNDWLRIDGGHFTCSGLSCRNADIYQTNGTLICTNDLVISGTSLWGSGPSTMSSYDFSGGSLVASNIQILARMRLQNSTNGIQNAGNFIFGGYLYVGQANESLGRLSIRRGYVYGFNTHDASLVFQTSNTVLRFADSATAAWETELWVQGWTGSTNGGGSTQLIFANGNPGLRPEQVRQIRFIDPAGFRPGVYNATLLPNGEVVPTLQPWLETEMAATDLVLRWTTNYVLQTTTNLSQPFIDLPGAVSPFTNSLTEPPTRFFRLRWLP